jgi:hypothetical protein
MRQYGYALLLLGVALLCACRQGAAPDPAAANPIPEPADSLAAAAKAVPAGKVQVELISSRPGGAAGEAAEYQWAVLGPLSPADMNKALLGLATPTEPGWSVVRLTLRVQFDKRSGPAAVKKEGASGEPGARLVDLTMDSAAVFYYPGASSGTSSATGHVKSGAVLRLQRSGPSGGTVTGGLTPLMRRQDLLEVGQGVLDDLVEPAFKGPETVAVPTTLELLRVGGSRTVLAIDP